MHRLLVLVGPCAVGKDTLQELVEELRYVPFKKCVSDTTRPIREGEVERENYYFTNNGLFMEMYQQGLFALEPKKYRPDPEIHPEIIYWYGVRKRELDLNGGYNRVIVVDMFGAKQLKKLLHDGVDVVYVMADEETRKERSKKRGDYEKESWDKRAEFDREMHKEACESGIIDYWLLNYDLNEAFKELKNFMGVR